MLIMMQSSEHTYTEQTGQHLDHHLTAKTSPDWVLGAVLHEGGMRAVTQRDGQDLES